MQVNHSGEGGVATTEAIREALAAALPGMITVPAYMDGDSPGLYEVALEEKRNTRGVNITNTRPSAARSRHVGGSLDYHERSDIAKALDALSITVEDEDDDVIKSD